MALLALFFFTWQAFLICLIGLFIAAPIGVNLGYHRLLSHRALVVPKWLEYLLATVGAIVAAGPPLEWVAAHRLHHRFSDQEQDLHNARKGFWHSHILHLFIKNDFDTNENNWKAYVPDLYNDRYLRFLSKYWLWFAVSALPVLYYYGGISFLLWGGFMRVVLSWHLMWFVNSASHMWGYRNYNTADTTTNCWWVGLLAAGEGWHNNHHAYPNSAAHGHKWWEFDFTYLLIRGLEAIGLATKVRHFSQQKTTTKL